MPIIKIFFEDTGADDGAALFDCRIAPAETRSLFFASLHLLTASKYSVVATSTSRSKAFEVPSFEANPVMLYCKFLILLFTEFNFDSSIDNCISASASLLAISDFEVFVPSLSDIDTALLSIRNRSLK